MAVKIKYSNKKENKTSSNIVLFVNDKFNISSLKKYITKTVSSSGSQKSEHIYPHINTYKHTSNGGVFGVFRFI